MDSSSSIVSDPKQEEKAVYPGTESIMGDLLKLVSKMSEIQKCLVKAIEHNSEKLGQVLSKLTNVEEKVATLELKVVSDEQAAVSLNKNLGRVKEKLASLRTTNPSDPKGPFLYSSPISMHAIENTDFLFSR